MEMAKFGFKSILFLMNPLAPGYDWFAHFLGMITGLFLSIGAGKTRHFARELTRIPTRFDTESVAIRERNGCKWRSIGSGKGLLDSFTLAWEGTRFVAFHFEIVEIVLETV